MKRKPLMMLLFAATLTISAQETKSIYPGQTWNDTKGKAINAHAGCVVREGDFYYWIGDRRSKNDCQGVGCYRSQNLVDWEDMGFALQLKGEARDDYQDFAAGRALYRPKIAYCDKTGKWVLNVVWENDNTGDVGMVAFATADHAYGPYSLEAVKYTYTSRTRDQNIFKDDDGRLWYQASINGNTDMWNCLMTDDFLSTTDTSCVILPKSKYEAPALFRVDDMYFGLFSGCTSWDPNRSRFAYGYDLLDTWKYEKVFTDKTGSGVDFAVDDTTKTTYKSQSAYVYKVDGDSRKLIYIGDRWNSSNLESTKHVWLPISMRSGRPTVRWYDKWDMSVFDDMYRFKRVKEIRDGDEVLLLERNSNRFFSRANSSFCIENDDETTNICFIIHETDKPFVYKLQEKSSGKYLECVFSSLRWKDENDNASQEWDFILQEDGTYIVKNVDKEYCLTVSGASTLVGSSIYLSEQSDILLQSFCVMFDSQTFPEREEARIFTKAYHESVLEEMERQSEAAAIAQGPAVAEGPAEYFTLSGVQMNGRPSVPGIYVVRTTDGNGRTQSKKIFVK